MYDDYIKQEKISSDIFLKSVQILDNRFIEEEYEFIKIIMDDINLINNIYCTIDDILTEEKLNNNMRYLFMGDFLFSMTSFDLTDPSNLIFKTTRNEYLERIRLRAIINMCFDCDPIKYIYIHKKLLIGLRLNGVLKKTEVRTIRDKHWETIIYFRLEIENMHKNYVIPLGSNISPFILVNLFKAKYSVGSFRNIWKIKRKKREMDDISLSYDGVIKANQIGLVLSQELLELNNKHIEKWKMELLNNVQCSSIEHYFEKMNKILLDDKYTNKLLQGKEKIIDVEFKEIIKLQIDIKKECIELFQKFQKFISLLILSKDIFNKLIYLPCFMDNRGRQYYATMLSPTFNKIFRHLYMFFIKKDFVNLDKSIFYKKIIGYIYLVEEFNLNERNSYILIILFIEVGKHFIKVTDNCFVKTIDMIKCGVDNYKNKNNILKFEDLLYIEKIYYLLDNLIKKNIIDENTIIFKDATASGLQNYGLMLGYQEDKLKFLNINGEDWCDTYTYVIQKFLKTRFDFLYKRKYWKSTIMTIPYNSVWYSCFIKFLQLLREDGIEYRNLTLEEKSEIRLTHKEFYENTKKNIKKEFYENTNINMIEFKYNKWHIVNTKEYKVNYKKARDKYTETLYMVTEDIEATQRALEANNMHHKDAELVYNIIKKFEIITIHDCFGIRLCELHSVIDEINFYYSKKIGKKTYSIHIIK